VIGPRNVKAWRRRARRMSKVARRSSIAIRRRMDAWMLEMVSCGGLEKRWECERGLARLRCADFDRKRYRARGLEWPGRGY
jgi:hypothetical protein